MRKSIIIGFVWLIGRLPVGLLQAVGVVLAQLTRVVSTHFKRTTTANIRHCFPNESPQTQNRLVYESLKQSLITLMEMPAFLTKKPTDLFKQVHHVYGLDMLDALYAQNKGVMLIGPHLGCWEIGSLYVTKRYDSTIMYKPPKIQAIRYLIEKARARTCEQMAPTTSYGIKKMIGALKAQQLLLLMGDQVPSQAGATPIDFFGISAQTMVLADKLHQRFQMPVVVAYGIRRGIGKGMDIYIESIDQTIDYYIAQGHPFPVAKAFTTAFESAIRQWPAQYQWGYKRFKQGRYDVKYYV